MANDLRQGVGSTGAAGASRSLDDLTAADNVATSVRVAKPDWMLTRFPVSIEEYRVLVREAEQPDPSPRSAATDDTLVEDPSTEVAVARRSAPTTFADVPEDDGQEGRAPGTGAPVITASFEATPQTGFLPPDCTLAVGPSDVLVSVNVDLAAYRKDGSLRFRWPNMTALFAPVLPQGAGLFDPKMAYDHYAGRWVVAVAARRQAPVGSWIMLAVSQTSDPDGTWWLWALDFAVDGSTPSNNWADYPTLGFDTRGGFSYAKLRVLNKSEAYAGAALRWHDFSNLKNPDNSLAFTVQSTMHFRGTGGNPPAYFCNARWPSGSSLTLWQLDDPLASWRGAQPSLRAHAVACRGYDLPPDAEQPDTTTRIETNDSRLLSSVFQFVEGTQRLWTAHTSKITWSGDAEARSAVQWYEIDTGTRQVVQQGGFGAPGFYYFFPVVQTDFQRNAHLCFSRCNTQEYGSLHQTGRRVTDPPNSLQASSLVKAGEGAYLGGRWGDYFGHARDGGDASQVWFYGEFADVRSSWCSWVCSTRF